jgi:hypothetical protein
MELHFNEANQADITYGNFSAGPLQGESGKTELIAFLTILN